MSDYVPIEVMDIMFAVLPLILDEDEESIPYHTSILTGQRKYDELINHENPHYFRAEARMDKEANFLSSACISSSTRRPARLKTHLWGAENYDLHQCLERFYQ